MNDWLERNRGHVFTALIILTAVGAMLFWFHRPRSPAIVITPAATGTSLPDPTPVPTPSAVSLIVYVSGAVHEPDVYTLPAGSRLKQAVEAAGGFTDKADPDRVNLAAPLLDGQQFHIPEIGEEPLPVPAPSGNSSAGSADLGSTAGKRVNINTATLDQLDALPGIGSVIGQRIIDYRNDSGPFDSIEQIKEVRGIGEATFTDIKNLITTQ